tara:strand:- start:6519 stop:7796 length:1278 start_codon:yes stop_codon:yes gene_type:complete
MKILLLLNLLTYCNSYLNNWFPVVPISSTNFNNPFSIKILNKDFVVWKKNDIYVVNDDSCPHRRAPLSEGYFHPKSKNIRCSYHGWEFDTNGKCNSISQSDNNNDYTNQKSCLKVYPTCVKHDLLWVFLGNYTNSIIDDYNLNDDTLYYMRDLPYNFYFLLENFLDPAHIPFAHHKLQSYRTNGSPLDITLLTELKNKKKLSFIFSNQKKTTGLVQFTYPNYYSVDSNINNPKKPLSQIHIFIVPIDECNTRIIMKPEFNIHFSLYWLIKIIPDWIIHLYLNRFLDSDSYLLYKQMEYFKKENLSYFHNKQYYMPTTSDNSVRFYRKWIKKRLKYIPFYKKSDFIYASKKQILDRYSQHTSICKYCKNTLQTLYFLKEKGTCFTVLLYILKKKYIFLFLSLFQYSFTSYLIQKFYYKDYIHNQIA